VLSQRREARKEGGFGVLQKRKSGVDTLVKQRIIRFLAARQAVGVTTLNVVLQLFNNMQVTCVGAPMGWRKLKSQKEHPKHKAWDDSV
jgi:hypothetical protein